MIHKIKTPRKITRCFLWEHTGSNRGPSACKADALNQLSYAPIQIRSANIGVEFILTKNLLEKVKNNWAN